METSIGWLLLLQVALILLNAVFACAEIAVLSVNEVKLNKLCAEGNRKAKRLSKLTAQPARFLSTIQVAITLAGFLGSASPRRTSPTGWRIGSSAWAWGFPVARWTPSAS